MKVTVVEYLAKKLKYIGIKNVFGLPGDYNFNILDAFIKDDEINWTNCTNELNAGYAADGYARINGYGAIVTTYGVGELSAINAVAGSYAESLPIIHIAGVPKTSFIKNNVCVHHNFSDVNYYVFETIYKNVTSASCYLDFENAKSEIDRVIDIAVNKKSPVYIAIPIDVCCHLIDDKGFDVINYEKSNEKNLNLAADKIVSLIEKSKNPIIFFDYLIKRFNLQDQTFELIDKTNMKFGTFLMAKGALNENNPNFIGVNTGNFAENVLNEIKNSDLIITAGFLNADLNTAGFSVFKDKMPDIEIKKTSVKIKDEIFDDVLIQDIIPLLAKKEIKKIDTNLPCCKKTMPAAKRKGKITVDEILPRIENILCENDVFVMETGLMSLSGAFLNLKNGMEYLSQTLWGSIGWAAPAAFGAMMADKKRNLILFTGEGAHQLTVQEIANYFEYDLKPVIFVLNNEGYTVERILSKDPDDKFNDITNWDYLKLIDSFSNGKDYYKASVSRIEDLDKVINEIKKIKGKKLCYVEIKTDKKDFTKSGLKLVSNMKEFSLKLKS